MTDTQQLDRWILQQRPPRNVVDPGRPYAFLLEDENFSPGRVAQVATIFLTNRECPWRCLMCDLWKNTLTESLQPGVIPAQVDFALNALAPSREARSKLAGLKLYNSGSFFDPRAIPVQDYPAMAERARRFERVIVECHPALVGERVLPFHGELAHGGSQLEVAMGLETAHPQVLEKLNKRMTLDDYARAAEFLGNHGIALRAFVLVKPPFIKDEAEALHWTQRSIDFAFECGAAVVSLIPTRFGNGALESLATQGEFSPPGLETLEAALDHGLRAGHGRVFADVWDLEQFSSCPGCFGSRRARLQDMNLRQVILPSVACAGCG